MHVASCQLVDDLGGAHRLGEPILARLQAPRASAAPHRGAEYEQVLHHAGVDEAPSDLSAAGTARNVDELLGRVVALVRLVQPAEDDAAREHGTNAKHDDEEGK